MPVLLGSPAEPSVTASVTVGNSLSWMTSVASFGLPMLYTALSEMSTVTVSSPSVMPSSIGTTVTVAETCPEGIVTWPGSVWKSTPLVAVPVTR